MENLNFYIFSHAAVGLISALIGALVLLKDYKRAVNRIFFLFASSVSAWAVSYAIWLLQPTQEPALFWARVLNFSATLIPLFFFHWIVCFLKSKNKKTLIYHYSITSLFLLFSFSDYYIKGTKEILFLKFFPQAGILYTIFLIFSWTLVLFYGTYLLVEARNRAVGSKKQQINYILLGSLIGFIGGSMNFILMFGIDVIPPAGSPLVVFFPIFFAYAMVKHKLMDIKMVLRNSSVNSLSLLTLATIVVSTKEFLYYYFQTDSHLVDIAILVLAASLISRIKRFYFRIANKYFFSSLLDSRELISSIGEGLRTTIQLNEIYDCILASFNKAFHLQGFAVLSYVEKKKNYNLDYNKGFLIGRKKKFPSSNALRKDFTKKDNVLVVSNILKEYPDINKEVIGLFKKLNIKVLIPLNSKNKIIGLLILGAKESGDSYTQDDIKTLEIVGSQVATSIENAKLYKESLGFNCKLTEEIEKATKSLLHANKKLTKLDKAKSEFISIASHQLRTPLTIIKGYISMILEGNFGKISKDTEESLSKVYKSNERLIQLVENLLNISRIESGRLQYLYEIQSFEVLLDSVIEELQPKIKEKNLKLIYKKERNLLLVNMDQEKVRQVLMNLIDNSIKYTQAGSLTITLKKTKTSKNKEVLEFCVSDTGMGIKPDDLPNLFKKFSRGTGTVLIHTEGTGLGLYVARQIMTAHKGTTWAESKGEDRGSKFFVRIPVYRTKKITKKIVSKKKSSLNIKKSRKKTKKTRHNI